MDEVFLWGIVLILMMVGMVGSLLPVLPGAPMILLGAVIYGFFTDFQKVTLLVIIILGGITLLALGIDWLASVYGARRHRASVWGVLGGIIGGIIGVMTAGLLGLLLGVFLISFLAEWTLGGRDLRGSMGVGWASLIGFLSGTFLKFVLSLVMVGIFLYTAWS